MITNSVIPAELFTSENFRFTMDGFECRCMEPAKWTRSVEKKEQKAGSVGYAMLTTSANRKALDFSFKTTFHDGLDIAQKFLDEFRAKDATPKTASLQQLSNGANRILSQTDFYGVIITDVELSGFKSDGGDIPTWTFTGKAEDVKATSGGGDAGGGLKASRHKPITNGLFEADGFGCDGMIKEFGAIKMSRQVQETNLCSSTRPILGCNSIVTVADIELKYTLNAAVEKFLTQEVEDRLGAGIQRNASITIFRSKGADQKEPVATFDFPTFLEYEVSNGAANATSAGLRDGSLKVCAEDFVLRIN